MTILSHSQLARIAERSDAATPGPWYWDGLGSVGSKPFRGVGRFVQRLVAKAFLSPEDAAFIAAARTDIPALLESHAEQWAELVKFKREPMSQNCRDGKHAGTGAMRCMQCRCLCHIAQVDA